MHKVAVVGAGSWGTTVASLSAATVPTVLWARRPEVADSIEEGHENADYLPGHSLPEQLRATASIDEAIDGASVIVMAVPSHGYRTVLQAFAHDLPDSVPVVSVTKGIEQESLERMTEILAAEAPHHDRALAGVLTGPNLAAEIVAEQPAAAVVAMEDEEAARSIQTVFMGPTFRVYTHDDVIGCELGGALKNVMAIAAGMSDGLGFGDNTKATLLTRALAELTRLGTALGGRPETFAGLAGMGDLIATCNSSKSRNHTVGVGLAEGKTVDRIVSEMNMVAEGIKTTTSVLGLAERTGVEMPIAEHVGQVLHQGVHPRDAVLSLMTREAKAEYA